METGESITVIDPAAEDSVTSVALVPRLRKLGDARIGLIDNSKHMAAQLLDGVQELLRERYKVEVFKRYRKNNPSVATPRDTLLELAGSCDAIVHGVAD